MYKVKLPAGKEKISIAVEYRTVVLSNDEIYKTSTIPNMYPKYFIKIEEEIVEETPVEKKEDKKEETLLVDNNFENIEVEEIEETPEVQDEPKDDVLIETEDENKEEVEEKKPAKRTYKKRDKK